MCQFISDCLLMTLILKLVWNFQRTQRGKRGFVIHFIGFMFQYLSYLCVSTRNTLDIHTFRIWSWSDFTKQQKMELRQRKPSTSFDLENSKMSSSQKGCFQNVGEIWVVSIWIISFLITWCRFTIPCILGICSMLLGRSLDTDAWNIIGWSIQV